MTLPLFEQLPALESNINAASHLFLFLDYDGTLSPIGNDPLSAFMPEATHAALNRLAGVERVSMGIISGRALADLRARVGIKNIIYAGNHGLEIRGPDLEFVEPAAALQIKALGELARHLRTRLSEIPGVAVENKVLSASVHFRRAQPERREEVEQVVRAAVESIDSPFEVTMGRKVFDVRPRVEWGKGQAVRWIKQMYRIQGALSMYMGDDATDEDAFSALPAGITISVGKCHNTSARYCLEEQSQVQRFLTWLAELMVHWESAHEVTTSR
jgi:trehalose 6-phosphate phosphatase